MKKLIYPIAFALLLTACASVEDEHTSRPYAPVDKHGAQPAVVNYAHSLIGIPYKYGGVSPSTGFDCSGFVRHVYGKKAGINLPHNAKLISRRGSKISRHELRPGDLVFYNTLGYDYSHVGVYIGDDKFIHSPSSGKKVHIVDMQMAYWKKRFNGARRLLY